MIRLTFRKPDKTDKSTIADWITRDPYHSTNGISADFFLNTHSLLIAVDDDRGPVMFIRIDPETPERVRVYVQFDMRNGRRTAVALPKAFALIRDTLRTAGITTMVFDSVSPSLISFCQKRLGFVPDSPGNYIATF